MCRVIMGEVFLWVTLIKWFHSYNLGFKGLFLLLPVRGSIQLIQLSLRQGMPKAYIVPNKKLVKHGE